MPFRERQKFKLHCSTPVVDLEESTLETGAIVKKSVNVCCKVMPDPALFDLEDNIKAKVNMQEVSSKILGTESIDGAAFVDKLTQQEQTNKEEVNVEDK